MSTTDQENSTVQSESSERKSEPLKEVTDVQADIQETREPATEVVAAPSSEPILVESKQDLINASTEKIDTELQSEATIEGSVREISATNLVEEQKISDDDLTKVKVHSIETKKSKEELEDHHIDDNITSKDSLSEKDSSTSFEHLEDLIEEDESEIQLPKKKLQVTKRRSLKPKEVKIGDDEVRPNQDAEEEGEEEEEYVWIEEEVDEEIEVETDEEEIGEEESLEEETVEGEEKIQTEEDMQTFTVEEDEEEEEEEAPLEEIEEILEEEVKEEEIEVKIREEEEVEIEEVEEEHEIGEAESVTKQIFEEDRFPYEEEEGEEGEEEEEEMGEEMEEEGVEEGLEEGVEEEEVISERKKKRKFRTIKVVKMIKMRKRDALKKLKEKAKPDEEDTEIIDEEGPSEIEIRRKHKHQLTEEAKQEREKVIEILKMLGNQIMLQKRKNKHLSKSIIDYCRQKKTENVHQTDNPTNESLHKYFKRLKLLKEAKIATVGERDRMIEEVDTMRDELIEITEEYKKEKAELLAWEVDVGKRVIKAQTGRPLEESVVNHIVQRHCAILDQLSEERLRLVTIQNQITMFEIEIKRLVALDGNLNLIDFEQLRMDNQVFSDKLEERDIELANLRKKILDIIHIHTHVLEKSDAVLEDIEAQNSQNHKLEIVVNETREKINKLRKTRDKLRDETVNMKKHAGLLIRPRLANDYKESVFKIKEAKTKLDELLKTYKKRKIIIEKLRKQIVDINNFNFWL